jgi:hypothetical protein
VAKAILVAQFLRARAWWRLDSAGASAIQVARSVVALLDAAAYLRDIPDDDPDMLALASAGCFRDGVFDPGPEGAIIVRGWQLANEATAGPRDLLRAMARANAPETADPQQAQPEVASAESAGVQVAAAQLAGPQAVGAAQQEVPPDTVPQSRGGRAGRRGLRAAT